MARAERLHDPTSGQRFDDELAGRLESAGVVALSEPFEATDDLVAVCCDQLTHEVPRAERTPLTVVRATVNNLRSTPLCVLNLQQFARFKQSLRRMLRPSSAEL